MNPTPSPIYALPASTTVKVQTAHTGPEEGTGAGSLGQGGVLSVTVFLGITFH